MPFTLTLHSPVVYVAWRGFTPAELDEVADRIAETSRTVRRGAVYLSRIPTSAHVFSDRDQRVLLGFLLRILPDCATIHHVVEGDGFIRSAQLATVANMAQATSRPRAFFTHATLHEATRAIAAMHGVDLADVLAHPGGTPDQERASQAFRHAARIVDVRRPPRKE